jgi:hypothetical protein
MAYNNLWAIQGKSEVAVDKSNDQPLTRATPPGHELPELAPPDYCDPVIEAYKKDVDRTLLRENLKLSVEQRIRNAESFHKDIEALREAGRQMRLRSTKEGEK